MDYILSNFPIFGLPIEQFCMYKGVKKKNFPSGTRVFETRVPLRKTEQHGLDSREKNFPQWNSSLKDLSSIRENFFPQSSV